jgi:molecular chaperone DnaK
MGKVIGIDLGTTNSCVAVVDGGKPAVIPNRGGYKTTPSVVAILEDGKRLVGQVAKRQAITNPDNTFTSIKRLIGRTSESPEVKIARAIYPYKIVEGPHRDLRVESYGKQLALPEVSAVVLMEMKRVAEDFIGKKITDAVITVPAYFNDNQRKATKDAGEIAGLNVMRIINEPTAAALAYGFNKKESITIAVYDLGGGTFDMSVLEISDGVFKVLATAGDTFLGGEDFDNRIIDYVSEEFQKEHNVDLRREKISLQRLKDAAEKAKCDLSTSQEVELNLPFVHSEGNNALHLQMKLDRKTLEALVQDLVDRTFKICTETLKAASLSKTDLDDVVLVGGQTRMPKIQDMVSNFFGRSPSKQVHPDEVVAIGAAIQADALVEEEVEMLLLDVTPFPLGIQTAGGTFTKLIEKNTTVPTSKHHIFTTVTDNQRQVKINVLQGDSTIAEENELLGEFILEGIRIAKAGEPQIKVTFNIDANGIVNVSAEDLDTGKEHSITITMSSGLTEEELKKMSEASKAYEIRVRGQEENEALAQEVEVLVHRVSKEFELKKDKLTKKYRSDIETLVKRAPGFIESKDLAKLKILDAELKRILDNLKSK